METINLLGLIMVAIGILLTFPKVCGTVHLNTCVGWIIASIGMFLLSFYNFVVGSLIFAIIGLLFGIVNLYFSISVIKE